MKRIMCLVFVVIACACFAFIVSAAEHPDSEHPGMSEHPGTHKAEHPGKKAKFSASQVNKAIKGHIDAVVKENNGYYPLTDFLEGKDLKLKLIRVHEDKISYIKKEDAYFACTDFVTNDGKATYDVDFWMKKGMDGKLEVYMTKIHKKDGTPRFTYKDDEIVPVK
jgi:hypothetical protein